MLQVQRIKNPLQQIPKDQYCYYYNKYRIIQKQKDKGIKNIVIPGKVYENTKKIKKEGDLLLDIIEKRNKIRYCQ